MINIACQTIVFGNPNIRAQIESILNQVGKIGYDGVEIGARHLDHDRPDYYKELLLKNNLKLLALHVGGNFLDKSSIKNQLQNISKTADFALKLGCHNLFLSGTYVENKQPDAYNIEAEVYNKIGKMCNDLGLTLCYHNHNWEIKNSCEGFKILMKNTDPKLVRLVPDVGWVMVGGCNPVEFLKEYIDRVEVLHFKEFDSERSFSEIGTGIVDFKAVYEFISSKRQNMWIVAEQDETKKTPFESAQENYKYIDGLRK
jgi:sugar phosphate isomerase/epimerase